jgi:hypothetical protein
MSVSMTVWPRSHGGWTLAAPAGTSRARWRPKGDRCGRENRDCESKFRDRNGRATCATARSTKHVSRSDVASSFKRLAICDAQAAVSPETTGDVELVFHPDILSLSQSGHPSNLFLRRYRSDIASNPADFVAARQPFLKSNLFPRSLELLDHLVSLTVVLHYLNRGPDPVAKIKIGEMELGVLTLQNARHARGA